jgi:protein-S-isoprenylcysteine O-methyltransferase Ste14
MNQRLFPILLAVCLFAHVVRTIYEVLKHKRIVNASRTTFIIIFTDMFLLWSSWFGLCSTDPHRISLPPLIKYFGFVLSASGLVLFLTALFTIKALESYEGDLISHGIYSKIRHPMYLSFIFWLIGFSVFSQALGAMVLAVLFVVNILFWRHLEEIELEKRFPGYLEYKKRTVF